MSAQVISSRALSLRAHANLRRELSGFRVYACHR
jgi:hypothetical protein